MERITLSVESKSDEYQDGYHDGYVDALREIINGDILDPVAHLAEMIGEEEE